MSRFHFSTQHFDVRALKSKLTDPTCGGYVSFEGWVRNHNENQEVEHLEYETFELLAVNEGERIIQEACDRFGVQNAYCFHRVGDLAVGELAVWVGVSARHRDEAFKACRYIIDEVKHRVPIWKKEHYVNGNSGWVNCERCAADIGTHDHEQGQHTDHQLTHNNEILETDYSRQISLREVGVVGQEKLRASTVAVIGAGGLGVPVLQYLSGAGLGHLIIIDGDLLEPSNLHRQTWYSRSDCGKAKAELASIRVRALNPEVRITTHNARLEAHNGVDFLRDCDLLIDCSDNFSTKFLLNDLAQQLKKPAIFASVYQYEGQLQVVSSSQNSTCLRCIWPTATRDGVIGNCAQVGVLGPVPGVLGTLQALEALKILLNLPGQLGNELLVIDLLNLNMTRIAAQRNFHCTGKDCTQMPSPEADIELGFETLSMALAAGLTLVDIRDAAEIAARPLPLDQHTDKALCIPMEELLAGQNLPSAGHYLLICSRGLRSRSASFTLRERGVLNVFSLRGGAQVLI